MKKILLIGLLSCITFAACRWSALDERTDSEDRIQIMRYDKLLEEYITSGSFSSFQKMNMQYRAMTSILIEDILEIGTVGEDTLTKKLKVFYADTTLVQLRKDVAEKFKDLSPLEEELEEAFEYLKKEIPSTRIPQFYSQITAFDESIILTDSLIGISLDKYMGQDYPTYKRFYYAYQRISMIPERIAHDCIRIYLGNQYPFEYDHNYDYSDLMIYSGIINYVTMKALGLKSPAKYLGYTNQQKEWCIKNEGNVWNYMVNQHHLIATDPMISRKYLLPAPFTAFFGEQAPQLLGIWTGMRIVEAYRKNNPYTTIEQLLQTTNYGHLLEQAHYMK